jgi:hypothetical protein
MAVFVYKFQIKSSKMSRDGAISNTQQASLSVDRTKCVDSEVDKHRCCPCVCVCVCVCICERILHLYAHKHTCVASYRVSARTLCAHKYTHTHTRCVCGIGNIYVSCLHYPHTSYEQLREMLAVYAVWHRLCLCLLQLRSACGL